MDGVAVRFGADHRRGVRRHFKDRLGSFLRRQVCAALGKTLHGMSVIVEDFKEVG